MGRLFKPELFLAALISFSLVGLLFHLVGHIRQAASLSSCNNNLRQLGIATHNYISANRDRTPPLVRDDGPVPVSVFALLTPFLEADPTSYRTGMDATRYHAESSVVFPYTDKTGVPSSWKGGTANQVRRTLIDPADTSAKSLVDVPIPMPGGTTGYYAAGSYVANGLAPWGVEFPSESFAGVILFAERPQVCRTAEGGAVHNLYGLGTYSPQMPAFGTLSPTESSSTHQAAPALPLPDEADPDRSGRILMRYGRRDSPAQAPDFPSPIQFVGKGGACDPRIPNTSHPAGMQVALADGSTRIYAANTEPWVFWEACLRRPVEK